MMYVRKYSALAIEMEERYGVPASIILAQGVIESDCGESTLTKLGDNHFGIKCFKKKCRHSQASIHCINYRDDTPHDRFRIYDSARQSFEAHARLVTSGRYEWISACGMDYRVWAHALKDSGYATDKNYAKKLIRLIEAYGLQKNISGVSP